jgi:hypothetical protein
MNDLRVDGLAGFVERDHFRPDLHHGHGHEAGLAGRFLLAQLRGGILRGGGVALAAAEEHPRRQQQRQHQRQRAAAAKAIDRRLHVLFLSPGRIPGGAQNPNNRPAV